MATSIELKRSQNATCVLEPLKFPNRSYLSCEVKKNSSSPVHPALDVLRGTRSPLCDAIDYDPMGFCSYRFEDLSRCGCPELDPNKHPQLWNSYVDIVKRTLKEKMRHQQQITMTIFASGHLLQDAELLTHLFSDSEIKKWNGDLRLQLVDLKYVIDDSHTKTEVEWKKMAPAILIGILGGVSCYKGVTEEKKQLKIVGVVMIIAALILGAQSLKKVNEQSMMKTFDQFINLIGGQTPFGLHVDFFTSADHCTEKGHKTDILLGNDITNALEFFEELKTKNLKNNGRVILVCKTEDARTKEVKKILSLSTGPQSPYQNYSFS